ncbi:unnamed protein product [Didymodactylos carnosus]|uniref:Fibronectin type-III domain-containing protein n=1 Tax=Didymodactylos carnosus TaxID=1234261 RepID=A0A8S2DXT7_9BILA|nr:unnamed protein product [Didymodactylos carnosus]CAF3844551.1 unnamed protein product [Didymodactylos carnosus]
MDVLADTRRHTARKSTVTRLLQIKSSPTHPPPLNHCENVIQVETTTKSSAYINNNSVSSSSLNSHQHLSQVVGDEMKLSLYNPNSQRPVSDECPSSIFETLDSSSAILEIKKEQVDANDQQIKPMIIIPDNDIEEVEDSANNLFGSTQVVHPRHSETNVSSPHVRKDSVNNPFNSSAVCDDIMENLKLQTEQQIGHDKSDNAYRVKSTTTARISVDTQRTSSTINSNLLPDYRHSYSTDSTNSGTVVPPPTLSACFDDNLKSSQIVRKGKITKEPHQQDNEMEHQFQNTFEQRQSRTEIPVGESEVVKMDQDEIGVSSSGKGIANDEQSSNRNDLNLFTKSVLASDAQRRREDDVCPMESETSVPLALPNNSIVEISGTRPIYPSVRQSVTVIDDDIVEIATTPAIPHHSNYQNVILVREDIMNMTTTSNHHLSSCCTCRCHPIRQSSDDDFHLFEQALNAQRQQQQTLSVNDRLIKFLKEQQKEFQQKPPQHQQAKEHRSQQTITVDIKEMGIQTEKHPQTVQQVQQRQITQAIIPPSLVVTSSASNPLIPPQLKQHTLQTAVRPHNPFSITAVSTSILSAGPILPATLHHRPTLLSRTPFLQPILPHPPTPPVPLPSNVAALLPEASVSPAQTVPSQHQYPTSAPIQQQQQQQQQQRQSQVTEIDLTNDDDDRPSSMSQTTIRPQIPQTASIPPPPNRTRGGNRNFRANIIQTGQVSFPIRPLPEHQPFDTTIARPKLTIAHENSTVRLHWNLQNTSQESIREYQIFAYKYNVNSTVSDWKQIGSVRSMRLPMAVTLKEFQSNSHYAFAVRAISMSNIVGQFCEPKTIFTGIPPNLLPLQTSHIQNVPISNGVGVSPVTIDAFSINKQHCILIPLCT